VIVREASPEALILELEAGRIDFIVGRLTVPSDERTVRRKLYDESVELVVRASHTLAGQSAADIAAGMAPRDADGDDSLQRWRCGGSSAGPRGPGSPPVLLKRPVVSPRFSARPAKEHLVRAGGFRCDFSLYSPTCAGQPAPRSAGLPSSG
jgi:DNA-binding transcriptional LysR family regulator